MSLPTFVIAEKARSFDPHTLQFGTTAPAWGSHAIIDLYGCSLSAISDHSSILTWITTLCDEVIVMKRYGEPLIVRFGTDPRVVGYSAVQLIETSNITAHFVDATAGACIDIFSCATFDPVQAATYCQQHFHAKHCQLTVLARLAEGVHHSIELSREGSK